MDAGPERVRGGGDSVSQAAPPGPGERREGRGLEERRRARARGGGRDPARGPARTGRLEARALRLAGPEMSRVATPHEAAAHITAP